MARSARAALMALHLSGVGFRRRWKPTRLELWEGPFADPNQRLPQALTWRCIDACRCGGLASFRGLTPLISALLLLARGVGQGVSSRPAPCLF